MSRQPSRAWSTRDDDTLRRMWCIEGKSASQIRNSKELEYLTSDGLPPSRNAILGRLHRLGLLRSEGRPRTARGQLPRRHTLSGSRRREFTALVQGRRKGSNDTPTLDFSVVPSNHVFTPPPLDQLIALVDREKGQCAAIVNSDGDLKDVTIRRCCGRPAVYRDYCRDHALAMYVRLNPDKLRHNASPAVLTRGELPAVISDPVVSDAGEIVIAIQEAA